MTEDQTFEVLAELARLTYHLREDEIMALICHV